MKTMTIDTIGLIVSRLGTGRDMLSFLASLRGTENEWMIYDLIPRNLKLFNKDFIRLGCTDLIPLFQRKMQERNLWTGPPNVDYLIENDDIDLPTLKHFHKNGGIVCSEKSMDYAVLHGNMDIVQWLHDHGYSCTDQAMNYAVSNGDLRMVKWLEENQKKELTTWPVDSAAQHGYLEIVQFLYSKGYRGSDNAIEWAANNRHHDVAEFIRKTR